MNQESVWTDLIDDNGSGGDKERDSTIALSGSVLPLGRGRSSSQQPRKSGMPSRRTASKFSMSLYIAGALMALMLMAEIHSNQVVKFAFAISTLL